MKISVIIPVYNVELYLEQCVSSVLNQTFEDFEIILVDDGSTDRSSELCEACALKDNRIHVYHKKNGGLSDARNYGISMAKGELITFIDADDYVAPTYLEKLYGLMEKYKADAACLPCLETDNREFVECYVSENIEIIDGIQAIKNSLTWQGFGVSACGKLFQKWLFNAIMFPVGEYYEDILTIPYVFKNCKKVVYSDIPLYYYYKRPGSITKSKITDNHLRFFDNMVKLLESFEQEDDDLQNAFRARFIIDSIKHFADILLFSPEYQKKILFVKEKMQLYWNQCDVNPYVPKTIRVQVKILSKSPFLYRALFAPYKYAKKILRKSNNKCFGLTISK